MCDIFCAKFPKIFRILLVFILCTQLGMASQYSGQFHLSPNSAMTYEEEYALFMTEETDDETHLSRQKRFVYLNVDTNLAVALLVGIPLSFVLPSMTNVFSSWRRKRSILDTAVDTKFKEPNAALKPETEKISTYFLLLDIPEPSCQLRAVCEFSADPEKYYPLSDVILRRIRNPHMSALMYLDQEGSASLMNNSLPREEFFQENTSLFEMYNRAADEGQQHGYERCLHQYAKSCKYPIDRLLNMPVIRFWNALQSLLNLTFKDVAMK